MKKNICAFSAMQTYTKRKKWELTLEKNTNTPKVDVQKLLEGSAV